MYDKYKSIMGENMSANNIRVSLQLVRAKIILLLQRMVAKVQALNDDEKEVNLFIILIVLKNLWWQFFLSCLNSHLQNVR